MQKEIARRHYWERSKNDLSIVADSTTSRINSKWVDKFGNLQKFEFDSHQQNGLSWIDLTKMGEQVVINLGLFPDRLNHNMSC